MFKWVNSRSFEFRFPSSVIHGSEVCKLKLSVITSDSLISSLHTVQFMTSKKGRDRDEQLSHFRLGI